MKFQERVNHIRVLTSIIFSILMDKNKFQDFCQENPKVYQGLTIASMLLSVLGIFFPGAVITVLFQVVLGLTVGFAYSLAFILTIILGGSFILAIAWLCRVALYKFSAQKQEDNQ